MTKYTESKKLIKTVLRMAKNYSSFFYFTMEANENMAFYSTLPFEKGQNFRDIVVYSTPELYKNFQNILTHCQKNAEIEILEESEIDDI
jgi:hypothetical protein